MSFHDFPAVEAYLNSLINYEQTFPLGGDRGRPKLEPALRAVERLGLSQQLTQCVHIAGTKGKGSTVHFLEGLLAGQGSVLSFSSPHLVTVKERVRLNGELLSDDIWQQGIAAIREGINTSEEIRLTYFESVWIFFLWCAQELKTQYHIVECGLGGRWDATNILQGTTALLTRVDYDHTEILGETLAEIAKEKAGIIKAGTTVIVGRQGEEALRVFEQFVRIQAARGLFFERDFGWTADSHDGRFRYVDTVTEIPHLNMKLAGEFQRDNAAAAICAARLLCPGLSEEQVRARLEELEIPARQQLLAGHPPILLDVAHNPISFQMLATTLRTRYAGQSMRLVCGMMRDKDAAAALAALRGLEIVIGCVGLGNPRSRTADELATIARETELPVRTFQSAKEAFDWQARAGECDLGVVAGSFYLAGDFLKWRRDAGIA